MNVLKKIFLLGFALVCSPLLRAELTIDITESADSGIPVAVVPFANTGTPVDVSAVVNADLARSGYFKMMAEGSMPSRPASAVSVNFPEWQSLNQNYLVVGQVNGGSDGQYNVQFQLLDVMKSGQMLGYQMNSSAADLRRTAHYIADLIFEKLTGKKGAFSGQIAYVTHNGQQSQLQVADADGFNPQTVTTSQEPLMSPSWSPDKSKIAYVSFERKTAAIYVQMLATGQRKKVAEFPGINGAPSWSPDGNKLALTLSKDGSPDIYTLNLMTGALTKLTKSYSIDTEPVWSPDGNNIVFTSDRGGRPQLYKVPSSGGQEQRITFSGDYNARASFSRDGKIAMVHGNGGDYRIGVMDVGSKSINVITTGPADESPSFAPNGSMVIYAAKKGGKAYLSAVSLDGKMQQRLAFNNGAVREPAWSP